jgi:hypothetical protein
VRLHHEVAGSIEVGAHGHVAVVLQDDYSLRPLKGLNGHARKLDGALRLFTFRLLRYPSQQLGTSREFVVGVDDCLGFRPIPVDQPVHD